MDLDVLNKLPCRTGDKVDVSVCIEGLKMRFPVTYSAEGKAVLSAEALVYDYNTEQSNWTALKSAKWTHEKCVSYIAEHEYNEATKKGTKFKVAFIMNIGEEEFSIRPTISQLEAAAISEAVVAIPMGVVQELAITEHGDGSVAIPITPQV